ncbi:MAG TPA: glycosyltransferase family 2 protein [Elusimicrobiota bacterium]|nr:glycosyltransferase family 2 protein [Elusimicrobiota bacterium]
MTPFVSVVVPCRNEARRIAACLDSLLANDYPKELMEILVADGMSEDSTRDIVRTFAARHPFLRLLDNPKKIAPTALNIAIREARGDVILRMDAHAQCPPNYISTLVEWLEKSGADNVGCSWVTLPGADTAMAGAIAAGLAHPFGVGNARYRLGNREPEWVDTVPFGCYRRSTLERIGLFDEELVRDQDDELNHRLLRRGGKILLVPGISLSYYARDTLAKLWLMCYGYGYYKPLAARKAGRVATVRQLAPAAFLLGLLGAGFAAPWSAAARALFALIASAYAALDLAFTIQIAVRERSPSRGLCSLVFPVLHFSYGFGYLIGLGALLRGRPAAREGT